MIMTKISLPLFIIFAFTACHERQGASPKVIHTSQQALIVSENSITKKQMPMTEKGIHKGKEQKKENIVNDIPILEENAPILMTPVVIDTETQTFTGGKRTDGLNIKSIRSSHTPTRTRLVFDSYNANTKATTSGKYTFSYDPSKRSITAAIQGYRKFSAILPNKKRTFPSNDIVKDIKMKKYIDDSGFKFSINLTRPASVNVFELKSPARIVVDILPN
jgi:hypothetical protein